MVVTLVLAGYAVLMYVLLFVGPGSEDAREEVGLRKRKTGDPTGAGG